ncbi:uncharacterized protein K02A2.6-like [Ixodes scapularis]|uniref:uncharacterized protein K02A2.6-like n=1 Tax=Ixodes scapularis TaxID=6945 RepID=UPI001A9FEF8B|nr:uncharacterized protein K02A2.6-like [Ixodes scapularis]
MSAARMQRWALLLAAYDYKWVYRKGSDIGNADALSRLPLPNDKDVSDYVHFFSVVDGLPLSADAIQKGTSTDRVLSKVLMYTRSGWPTRVTDSELSPYFVRRHELSVDQQCVTWGNRVIVPRRLRKQVLALMHEGHPGVTRIKMLARSYVWWPQLTQDIECAVKSCSTCQLTQNASPKAPLQTWGWPSRRWQRIHLDFAFTDNQWLLVLVDVHSKWVEVFVMSSTTAEKTMEKLRSVFAAYGLPEEVVTDNGPQFTAKNFTEFLLRNGVRHTRTPPYHPASNGSAERCVQTVKRDLLRQLLDENSLGVRKTLQHRIDQFLFRYRNTPTTTTGQTPAELFLSWKPRTRLTLLQPDLERRIADRFFKIKSQADDRRGPWRSFEEGERVIVQGLRPGEAKWLPGVIERRCSAVTYIVRVGRGTRFVHAENLRPRYFESDEQGSREPSCVVPSSIPDRVPEASATSPPLPALESPKAAAAPPEPPEDSAPLGQRNASPRQGSAPQSPLREPASPQGAETLRRSARARKPPDWYTP